jgi:hypothetical protein
MKDYNAQKEALDNLSRALRIAQEAGLVLGIAKMYNGSSRYAVMLGAVVQFDEIAGLYLDRREHLVIDK